jgi:hypothetical protein
VPALIKLGVIEPAAHMFALLLRDPVGDHAAGGAGGLRGGRLAKAISGGSGLGGGEDRRAGFIVPFMFVYEPALLMIGDWPTIIRRSSPRCIGVAAVRRRPARLFRDGGDGSVRYCSARAGADQSGPRHRHAARSLPWSSWSASNGAARQPTRAQREAATKSQSAE